MNIGIIGRTAENSMLYDGQTIKTRVLRDELRTHYPDSVIKICDTYNFKKRLPAFLKDIFFCMKNSDVVFILLSRNGMKYIFPIVDMLNKIFKKPVYHDVIGGSLAELVKSGYVSKRCLCNFEVNWVESANMKKELELCGIPNVEVLPNFKRITTVSYLSKEKDSFSEPFSFCTFSRVMKEKGITNAINTVRRINEKAGRTVIKLDIYGPVADEYKKEFEELLSVNDEAVSYKGIAEYNKSVEVLKDYYAMLFPTYFFGEGFPGSVVDAFAAGVPVIASDWHCNPEIIIDGYTGFLYKTEEPDKLEDAINRAIHIGDDIIDMKNNCISEAEQYTPEIVMQTVYKRIETV